MQKKHEKRALQESQNITKAERASQTRMPVFWLEPCGPSSFLHEEGLKRSVAPFFHLIIRDKLQGAAVDAIP